MSEELVLELDFSNVQNPAIGFGIAVLPAGIHMGKIAEIKAFGEGAEKRLYVYYDTVVDGQKLRHRDSNGLNEKSMPFLAGLLVSASVDPKQFLGKKVKFPLHKIVGRTVYFNYTPPPLDENGNPVKGKYANYTYLTQSMYNDAAKERAAAKAADTKPAVDDSPDLTETTSNGEAQAETPKVEAQVAKPKAEPTKPAAQPKQEAAPGAGGDDFAFLDGD